MLANITPVHAAFTGYCEGGSRRHTGTLRHYTLTHTHRLPLRPHPCVELATQVWLPIKLGHCCLLIVWLLIELAKRNLMSAGFYYKLTFSQMLKNCYPSQCRRIIYQNILQNQCVDVSDIRRISILIGCRITLCHSVHLAETCDT